MNTTIRALTSADWPSVAAIYREGIETGEATFETAVPAWEDWDAGHLVNGRLIAAAEDGTVLGWAALTPVSGRCVYAGVAEVSVYVAAAARGQGVGKLLLRALVEASEADGSGPCRRPCSPKIEAAWPCTKASASGVWACVKSWVSFTASGATCS
jgi:L-amino acid N-acyltransferase YncA